MLDIKDQNWQMICVAIIKGAINRIRFTQFDEQKNHKQQQPL